MDKRLWKLTGCRFFLFKTMFMRNFLPAFFVLIGCASVPPNQTQNVKTFAKAARSFSSTPGYFYQTVSDFRQQLRLIESSTLFTSDKIIPSLNQSMQLKKRFDENAIKINSACSLIGIYADGLLSLTEVGYFKSLQKDTGDLILDFHLAIQNYNKAFRKKLPGSIGDILGFAFYKLGSAKLDRIQKKYMKEFVDSGSLIINDVCAYFNDVLIDGINNEMGSLDKQFDNVMLNFYDNIEQYQRKQNVNPFDY